MKRAFVLFVLATAIVPVNGSAAVTIERGARASLTEGALTAAVRVEEVSTVGGGSTRGGSLTLTTDAASEVVPCTYEMSGDPFLTASGSMRATCGEYEVTASFVIPGGGAGDFALVCRADLSRGSQTRMHVTRGVSTIVQGTTTNSRVWTNVDLGTCEDDG